MSTSIPRLVTSENPGALKPLIGASLLSSVGSLPLHLAPFIVATVVGDATASVAQAGLIPSSTLLGQLTAALTLPAFGVRHVQRWVCGALGLCMLLGLGLTTMGGIVAILMGWFMVGLCCGTFLYVGTMAAARFPDRVFAFSIRLALVLVLSGCAVAVLYSVGALARYGDLVLALALVLSPLMLAGLMAHAPGEGAAAPAAVASSAWSKGTVASLAVIFFFFLGQTGFLSYVLQQAAERGMALNGAILALVAAKALAGLWIGFWAMQRRTRKNAFNFLLYGGLLASINVFAFLCASPFQLFLAFCLFEIVINALAAQLQGAITASQPAFVSRWLTGSVLLGAASGPLLNGFAISHGFGVAFIAMSAISAVMPLALIMYLK